MGHNLTPTKTSTGPGNWSDPTKWTGGTKPAAGDVVSVIHAIALDEDSAQSLAGLLIDTGGTLTFSAGASRTLHLTGNYVLAGTGRLVTHPSSASVIHKIAFHGVNEAAFAGADPLVVTAIELVAGTTYKFTVSLGAGQTDHNLQVGDKVKIAGVTGTTPSAVDAAGSPNKTAATVVSPRTATSVNIDLGGNFTGTPGLAGATL